MVLGDAVPKQALADFSLSAGRGMQASYWVCYRLCSVGF